MDITVLIYILLIIAAAKVLGEVVTRFNQPQIVGELLAGIILGPFAIGAIIPQIQGMYSDEIVQGLADLGILFLMLIVGLEFNPKMLLKSSTSSIAIAAGGMMLPLALGFVAAILLGQSGPAVIFIALALSVTALPVTIRILKDMEVIQTTTGRKIIMSAIFTDISLLFALAIVLREGGLSGAQLTDNLFNLAIGYILFFTIAILVGHFFIPHLFKILKWMRSGEAAFGITVAIAIAFAVFATMVNLPEFIGAFAAGMMMREAGTALKVWTRVEDILTNITMDFLAPIFFVLIGFSVNFAAVFLGGPSVLLLFGAVLTIAIVAKMVGTYVPARLTKLSKNESMAIASMMMSKGAMELVFAKLALQQEIIDEALFSVLVLMAFVSTLLAPILFRHYFNKACVQGEIEGENCGKVPDAPDI
jgi:Kef-type K+ transport system membrane component KefB